jgi:hypothetical protein
MKTASCIRENERSFPVDSCPVDVPKRRAAQAKRKTGKILTIAHDIDKLLVTDCPMLPKADCLSLDRFSPF